MRGQVAGDTRAHVELGVELDEIEADDAGVLCERGQAVAQFGVEHPVRLGRDAARDEGEVQHVDVDAQVAGCAPGHEPGHERGTPLPETGHGDDVVSVGMGIAVHFFRRPEAPDADLGERLDVGQVRDVPEGVGIGHGRPVHEGHVVEVRVEVHNVERLLEGPHDGVRDGMVTAQHHRGGSGGQGAGGQGRDVVKAPPGIGRDDVGIADVHDAAIADLSLEEPPAEDRVEVPGLARHEPQRVLPNCPGTEARSGKEGGALVGRGPEDDDVRVELPIGTHDRGAEKGGDSDEREIRTFGGSVTRAGHVDRAPSYRAAWRSSGTCAPVSRRGRDPWRS